MPQFDRKDPGTLDDGIIKLELRAYIEDVETQRSHVPYYEFDIIDLDSGQKAGGIVLRAGYNPHIVNCAGHIGYGVEEAFRGRRYAARAVRLISSFALELGMPYSIITTRPDNAASIRSAEIAGYSFAGTAVVPEDDEMFSEGERVMNRYFLNLGAHAEGECSKR